MMKFKEFLLEEKIPPIHKGITANKLLALSKANGIHRFHIRAGNVYAGKALHYGHVDLHDVASNKEFVDYHDGMILYDKDTGRHEFYGTGLNDKRKWTSDIDHKFYRELQEKGAVRISRSALIKKDENILECYINEGKVHQVETMRGNNVDVYLNPNKEQAQTLGSKAKTMRSLRHRKNIYAWDAHELLHRHVADKLGIPYEETSRGFFYNKDLVKHDYNIPKCHRNSIVVDNY